MLQYLRKIFGGNMKEYTYSIWKQSGKINNAFYEKDLFSALTAADELNEILFDVDFQNTFLTNDIKSDKAEDKEANLQHLYNYKQDIIKAIIKNTRKKPSFGKPKSYAELIFFARIVMDDILRRSELKTISKSELNKLNTELFSLKEKLYSLYKYLDDKITQSEKNSFYEIIDEIDYNREKRFGFEVLEQSDCNALTSQF